MKFLRLVILGGSLFYFAGTTWAGTRLLFREPQLRAYELEPEPPTKSVPRSDWITARRRGNSHESVELGSRVVLQLVYPGQLTRLIEKRPLKMVEQVAPGIFILQAPDALTAATHASELAALPNVLASYCVIRRPAALHGPYAPRPNDRFFPNQWPLEHRATNGARLGPDLNVRAAWPFTKGSGVTIAVADVGVELTHPELSGRAAGAPHHSFVNDSDDGTPIRSTTEWAHGTSVAGLALAEGNNGRGMTGVAPEAKLASWAMFTNTAGGALIRTSDEQLMKLYQFESNSVAIQNHSWGNRGVRQEGPTLLEQIGLSNAFTFGRNGRGVIMVRSCGNDRGRVGGANVNDDGYPSDSRVIAVAAVRPDGRVASYSEPGAPILVSAPSADTGLPQLVALDLLGSRGANQIGFFDDSADYRFNILGFSGTSSAAAFISGVAALVLSANSNLHYRDVQQILVQSARHFDFADPDLRPNGAGFLVSHNTGFGVPDAGQAVRLALNWPLRPAQRTVTFVKTNTAAVPDDALRLLVSGVNIPENLQSIHTLPALGPFPDEPTPRVPVVFVGLATNVISQNLAGKAALIELGINSFAEKIEFAAAAGATFAILYNPETNRCSDQVCPPEGTEFVPIPAVFIGHTSGEAMKAAVQQTPDLLAQLSLTKTNYEFAVTETLLCEHVAVRLQTDHPLRGDLRFTLVSPQGTRSILQSLNDDTEPGPVDWTYTSTHHFYESSAGLWRLEASDLVAEAVGNVLSASLTIFGVPITDIDRDGLDDEWERAQLGSMAYGPNDDFDGDGYSNAREQIIGTHAGRADELLKLDISPYNNDFLRLSWFSNTNRAYHLYQTLDLDAGWSFAQQLNGQFVETEQFVRRTNSLHFFRLESHPK